MPTLQVGYRFTPTDQELIRFLESKVKGEVVVQNFIVECDIYGEEEPWLMFNKNAKDDVYVFTKLKSKSKSMMQRTAGCGTWVGQRIEEIYSSSTSDDDVRVIGFKKLFIFATSGKQSSRENGHWIMHEFSIGGGRGEGISDHEQENNDRQHVLCRIRNKDMDKVNMNILTMSEFEDIMRISGTPLTLQMQDNIDDSMNNHSDDEEETQPRKRVRHVDVKVYVATDQGSRAYEGLSSQEPQLTAVVDLQQQHQLLQQQHHQDLQAHQLHLYESLALMTMRQQLEFYQQQNPYLHELIDSSHENQHLGYLNWNNPAYANLQNDPHGFYEPAVSMALDGNPLMALPSPMNVINNGNPQVPYLAEKQSPHHELPALPASFSFDIPSQEVAMNNNSFTEEPLNLDPISFSQDSRFGAGTDFCRLNR